MGRNPRDLNKWGEMPTEFSPSFDLDGCITLKGMENFLNSTDTSHTDRFSIFIFFFFTIRSSMLTTNLSLGKLKGLFCTLKIVSIENLKNVLLLLFFL